MCRSADIFGFLFVFIIPSVSVQDLAVTSAVSPLFLPMLHGLLAL
jgi:hypothetical protein